MGYNEFFVDSRLYPRLLLGVLKFFSFLSTSKFQFGLTKDWTKSLSIVCTTANPCYAHPSRGGRFPTYPFKRDFYGITESNVNSFRFRLIFSVIGNLPLQLNCSYPGKWFTIESVSKKNDAGGWQDVPAAVAVTEHVCKATRVQGVVQGVGSYCTVRGNITEIIPDDEIKVEYFCWEFGKIWTYFSSLFLKRNRYFPGLFCELTRSDVFFVTLRDHSLPIPELFRRFVFEFLERWRH